MHVEFFVRQKGVRLTLPRELNLSRPIDASANDGA